MKVAGYWSGHDCSYCVLEDGRPVIHDEYERFIREKEPAGDSLKFMSENYAEFDSIKHFASCYPSKKSTKDHPESHEKIKAIVEKNGGQIHFVGHHQAHAANAFFSSNFEKSAILTLDGGGIEDDNMFLTACTFWQGEGTKVTPLVRFPYSIPPFFNIGSVWTRVTRYVFQLQSGWPTGHQAGSVMAMAAFGDPSLYEDDFYKMLTVDNFQASFKPPTQPKGACIPGKDPVHPYLNKWKVIAEQDEKNKFDLAAGLQSATEKFFKQILNILVKKTDVENLCISGGVTLNCVMVGKIKQWFPQIKNIYATPCPHDGGLTLGAAQYVWHHILGNERIKWSDNFTPYLGKTYTLDEVQNCLSNFKDKVEVSQTTDEEVVEFLNQQKIVAVFGGGSESGRRALGNRSILADPRSLQMKDIINEKVKHRQWYRPFAPSIMKEYTSDWFIEDNIDSPYMSFVYRFTDEAAKKVAAVAHKDNSARLQTVTENDNHWYYNFLKKWNEKSGVPILLNTSFNDREPICETPQHAVRCFLGTDIDYLYFRDYNILVKSK